MRKLLFVPVVLILASCESMPSSSSMQMNFNGQNFQSGPTNIHDARFGSPEFYSESDNAPLPAFRP